MSFPTYTRLPFSAYTQNPSADAYNAGYAEYGSQINSNKAYDANQRRLAAQAAWKAQHAASAENSAATKASYDANQRRLAAQAAWKAQQDAYGQNTYSNRVALEQELAQNENEILSLQTEIDTLRSEWGDLDSIYRKLAANRAAIGDFGNARGHQNDIINRQNERNKRRETEMQWRWQANQNRMSREEDQKKQAQADIKRIIEEIEDIDAQIPYHTELGAQNALKAKRNRLVSELASYGVSIDGENNVDSQGSYKGESVGENNGPDTVAIIRQDEASSTDKNGRFLDAEKRESIATRYEKLGLKDDAKRVRNTLTVPEYNARDAKIKSEKEKARKLVGKYQQMTPAQFAVFKARWNRNDPNDEEIQILRKHATFDGKSAPVMK